MADVELTPQPPVSGPAEPPSPTPDGTISMRPAFAVALAAVLSGAFTCGLILQTPPYISPNETSRWNAVAAIVKTGRCSWVGHEYWWTIDRCTYDPIDTSDPAKKKADMARARWYSSKPYFMQVLLAGIAWPICRIGHLDIKEHLWIVGRAGIIVFNALPFALLVAFFGKLMLKMGVRGFAFAYCLVAATAGTYLTAWCVTLNNHLPAAWCVFFAMYAAFRIAAEPAAGRRWYAMAGLFGGLAAAFETQAAAVPGLVGVWLAYRSWVDRKPAAWAFVPAAIIPIAGFFVTNYVCTGQWLPFQWRFPQHYDPYWQTPTGLDALHEPKHIYLMHLTIGHHGFFSLTPIFVISLLGAIRLLSDGKSPWRPLAAIVLVATAAVIAFETVKTSNYGGTCQGARWLFWLVSMWLLMLPAGIDLLARAASGRALALALLAVSTFSMAYAIRIPWSRSWLHELCTLAGIVNY